MLSSSPNLSAKDVMDVELARSRLANNEASRAHSYALSEKVRQEVEMARAAERQRQDPNMQTQYAGNMAGVTMPVARMARDYVDGRQVEAAGPVMPGMDQPVMSSARPDGMNDAQMRAFQGSLAALAANMFATGKTNAQQLSQAAQNNQETGNRTVLAQPGLDVAARTAALEAIGNGQPVAPYRQNSDGTSVINTMSGGVTDAGTVTAGAQNALTGAKTKTEGARQGELGSRANLNNRRGEKVAAETADIRAGRPRSYKPGDPMQAEKRFSDMTTKEYGALDRAVRKTMTLQQYQDKRRTEIEGRLKAPGGQGHMALGAVYDDAMGAIAKGKDPAAVKRRFKELTGVDLPDEDLK
jgi:hypothetical protein